MGILETVIAATQYPVTLTEVKRQLSLDGNTAHDDLLNAYIAIATEAVEDILQVAIMGRQMRLHLTGFPGMVVPLQIYPVLSVTSIIYDTGGSPATATVDSADYWAFLQGMNPHVKAVTGWPNVYAQKPGNIRILFEAGYNDRTGSPVDDVTNVPEPLRQAILVTIYELWQTRGEAVIGTVYTKTSLVDRLTSTYRNF